MDFDRHIFPENKTEYIKGKKPDVDCILCAIVRRDSRVQSLVVAESENIVVSVNLYPYNNGHLLLFPRRHILDIRQMTGDEERELAALTRLFLDILDGLYHPSGFNVGCNTGRCAGASIPHIHQHVIPRYPNELGVIDLIGGARVIIENPADTLKKLSGKAAEWGREHPGLLK